jgi:cell division protease FtsH
MGHALVATSLKTTDPVEKVSIIPRSIGALGYTLQRPTEDRFLITTNELRERMTVLLAGRAGEEIIFKEISTGAADDLVKATDIARQIATRFGMDQSLGQAVLEVQRSPWLGDSPSNLSTRDYSEETSREIDLAIRKMLDESYAAAKSILKAKLKELKDGAKLLLERETITAADFSPLKSKKRN